MSRSDLMCLPAAAMLVGASMVWADPPSGAAPSDADALRGPTVAKAPDRPERSIVERDFQGRLRKLEEPPALVALDKLSLDPEEKKRADEVLGARAAALDTIVRDNLQLLVRFAQAKEAGDAKAAAELQPRILEKAAPFLKRGSLLSELRTALSDEHFAELGRMVGEYARAEAEARAADPMTGAHRENRVGALIAQGVQGLALEAKASFERIVGGGGREFDALLKRLNLTPQQEGRIRQKASDLFQKTSGKPTKLQQIQFFLQIYGELDADQRARLTEYIGEENRATRGAPGKREKGGK